MVAPGTDRRASPSPFTRGARVAASLLLAVLVVPVALAGELSPETFEELNRHFVERLNLNPGDTEALAEVALLDEMDDYFSTRPGQPLFGEQWGDISAVITWEVDLAPSFTMNQTCGEMGVMCPQGMEQPASGTYYAYTWMSLDDIQTGSDLLVAVGIAAYDEDPLSGARPAPWRSEFENDLYEGMNLAFEFQSHASSEFSLYRLAYDPDGENNFVREDTGAFGILDGQVVTGFIPEAEWEGVINGRTYGFYSESNGPSGADTYPDIQEPALAYDALAIPHLVQAPPPPATPSPTPRPTASPTPSPSPTLSPSPTPIPSPTATAQLAPGPGAGPVVVTPSPISFESLIVLLIAVLLILLGLGFLFWRRGRPAPGG